MNKNFNRREAIKQISVVVGSTATAIVLPSSWTKPVMDAVVGPAGAKFISYCAADGTRVTSRGTFPPGSPVNFCPQPTATC
jgi:hypothetical protein